MTLRHRMRLGSMKWTDKRAKVLLEVLGTYPCGILDVRKC